MLYSCTHMATVGVKGLSSHIVRAYFAYIKIHNIHIHTPRLAFGDAYTLMFCHLALTLV